MITGMLHVNIVCTDIERSLKFYRDILGAKVVVPDLQGDESPVPGKIFGFKGAATFRGCLLAFGGSKSSPATFIDLLQWIKPPAKGKPYASVLHVGIPRICLGVDDIDKTYEDLKAKGVQFISPPQYIDLSAGSSRSLLHGECAFRDPDGVVLQLTAPVAT